MSQQREITDEASEYALLSLIFASPTVLDKTDFSTALFSGPRRELAKTLAKLRAEGQKVNAANVLLRSKSEDQHEQALKLSTRTLGGSYELLSGRLREIRIRARMADTCRKYHEAAFDEGTDYKELVEGFESDAMKLRGVNRSNLRSGTDYGGVMELIEWRQRNVGKIRGITTGFERLDNMIDGLIPRYIVLGARTSVGKTSLALCIVAELLRQRKRVLYFAGEDAEQLKTRLLSIMARVQTGRMERAYTQEELDTITRTIAFIKSCDWILDDTPNPSIGHIQATARRLHREKPIDAIFGDFIQLMKAMHAKPSDKRAVVDEVSKGWKAIVGELKVPCIVLSQIKRKDGILDHKSKTTEIPKPELNDLKEAGAIEEDADLVWLLHRDQKNNSSRAELNVAKSKDGETGVVNMEFTAINYYFKEV